MTCSNETLKKKVYLFLLLNILLENYCSGHMLLYKRAFTIDEIYNYVE